MKGYEYHCPTCSKEFTRKANLTAHIKNIHGERNELNCDQCEAVFTRPENLKRHIATVHQGKRRVKCGQCDAVFTRKSDLTVHIRTIHEQSVHFSCSHCHLVFNSKTNLRRHITHFHKGRRAICPICKRSYYNNAGVKRHMKSQHPNEVNQLKKSDLSYSTSDSESTGVFCESSKDPEVYNCGKTRDDDDDNSLERLLAEDSECSNDSSTELNVDQCEDDNTANCVETEGQVKTSDQSSLGKELAIYISPESSSFSTSSSLPSSYLYSRNEPLEWIWDFMAQLGQLHEKICNIQGQMSASAWDKSQDESYLAMSKELVPVSNSIIPLTNYLSFPTSHSHLAMSSELVPNSIIPFGNYPIHLPMFPSGQSAFEPFELSQFPNYPFVPFQPLNYDPSSLMFPPFQSRPPNIEQSNTYLSSL